jgi:hypothetical protein
VKNFIAGGNTMSALVKKVLGMKEALKEKLLQADSEEPGSTEGQEESSDRN